MNLHEWITQRVEAVEGLAREAEGGAWAAAEGAGDTTAAALRRCEADRRVLARHRMAPEHGFGGAVCDGCGVYGDCDWAVTDNINECPELLDLAHAHGITEAELAALDTPQTPPRLPSLPVFVMARMTAEQVPATFRGAR